MVFSAGAFIRVCHTQPKVRLRLPHQGAAEVHQEGYRLVLLPKMAFFALWDGVGAEYRVPRAHSLPVPTPASCGVHDCAAPWRLAASVSASHASGAPASPIHSFGCQLESRCGAHTCPRLYAPVHVTSDLWYLLARGLSTLQSMLQPGGAPSDPTNAPLLPSCSSPAS